MGKYKIYFTIPETYSIVVEADSVEETKDMWKNGEYDEADWEDSEMDYNQEVYITEV